MTELEIYKVKSQDKVIVKQHGSSVPQLSSVAYIRKINLQSRAASMKDFVIFALVAIFASTAQSW